MRVPDIVYRFTTHTDSAGPTLELFQRQLSASASATSVSIAINGPGKDRVLIVTNIVTELIPGATQSGIRFNIEGRSPAMLDFRIAADGRPAVADLRQALNWQGEVAIGGGGIGNAILNISGTFSAGVAANAIAVGVFGYVIPHGNIAPF